MSYRVLIRPSAERDLSRIDPSHRRRLAAKIDGLTGNPRPTGCVKLTGSAALWRVRVGDYRIVYSISDVVPIVEIIHVAHRRECAIRDCCVLSTDSCLSTWYNCSS